MTDKKRYVVSALRKGLGVLDLFSEDRRALSLSEIARLTKTHPGSMYPTLYTLQQQGYLERDPTTKTYRLGLKLLAQANLLLASLDVREQAKPSLKNLARQLAANAHLAVLYDDEVLYLDREEAAPSVLLPSIIGLRVPSYCTALGKALLAYRPESAERVLARGEFPRMTERTITKAELLRVEFERIRKQGFALDNEEFHANHICVAAPIRCFNGTAVAAISVSFEKSRIADERVGDVAKVVAEAAERVSRAMGLDP